MVEEGAARRTRTRVKRVLRSISERWRTSEVAASEDFYICRRASRIVALEGYTGKMLPIVIKTPTNCRIYVEQESL